MSVISAPNLVKLRTQRHASALRLAVYAPAQIWTAQINGLQTQGDTTITVKNVAQVRAPAKNYQVLIGASAGSREYGEARFRSYSAPTLTVSAHNAILPDNAYITILEWIPPVAIHNTIDATDVVFEDGNIAYTNENVNYMPLARMGAPACAYVDPATNQATLNFYGRGTAIATGATLSSHAWVFGAGSSPATSAIQGTSGSPIAVTYTGSGVRYVSYTVTDSNGKTHTRYTPVFIFDRYSGLTPYTNIEISGMQVDASIGTWSASVKVYTDADYTDFPPMGECVLFTEDYYGDVLGSIGNELYRENIKLHGYIRRGTIRKNWQMGYVEFDLVSVPMDAIPQLAGGLETTTGTPADWHVLKNQTYDLAAHHVLTQHTTLSQIADVYLNALPSYTIEFVDLPKTSLGDLLTNIVRPIRSRWGFSAQGSLHLEINPQLQSFASRSVAYQITTTFDDFRDDLDFGDDTNEKQVGQIVFTGEDANADPLFSLAPAFPYENSAIVDEVVDGIRVANQIESNEFSGLFEGYRNNDLANVVIPWRGNYPMDCFPAAPIAVSIAANQNARGIVWSNKRCWIKQVSCEYRNGAWLVTTTIEKDAYGTPGITDVYALTDPPTYPITPPPIPDPFPPVPIPVPPNPTIIPQGRGNLLYVHTLHGLAKCVDAYGTDGTDGVPVWSNLSATKVIGSGTITQSSYTITGYGTAFLSQVSVGDRIIAVGIDGNVVTITNDTSLTLDTSASVGAAATFTLMKLNAGLLNPNALKIRLFNLDPFSVSGTVFTRGYAMTDDGLYIVSGLPNSPTWSQILNVTAAETLAGITPGTGVLCWNFTPSVRSPNFLMTGVLKDIGGGLYNLYVLWSLDNGATWNCDPTHYIEIGATVPGFPKKGVYFHCSYHLDSTYYIGCDYGHEYATSGYGTIIGYDGTTTDLVTLMKATTLPHFTPYQRLAPDNNPFAQPYTRVIFPYSDTSGVVYPDDKVAYASDPKTELQAISKVNDMTAQTFPTIHVCDALLGKLDMLAGALAAHDVQTVDFNMFNSSYVYSFQLVDGGARDKFWVSSDGGVNWTTLDVGATLTISQMRGMFPIPVDRNIFFIVGETGAGLPIVAFSKDFGVNFTRIDNSTASLQVAMILQVSDLLISNIFVDYFKV